MRSVEQLVVETPGDKGYIYEKMADRHKRIIENAKEKLVVKMKFGERPFEEMDQDIIKELNLHYLENDGYISNQIFLWDKSLEDMDKDADEVESVLADHFANTMYTYLTKESKFKNRFNN